MGNSSGKSSKKALNHHHGCFPVAFIFAFAEAFPTEDMTNLVEFTMQIYFLKNG